MNRMYDAHLAVQLLLEAERDGARARPLGRLDQMGLGEPDALEGVQQGDERGVGHKLGEEVLVLILVPHVRREVRGALMFEEALDGLESGGTVRGKVDGRLDDRHGTCHGGGGVLHRPRVTRKSVAA